MRKNGTLNYRESTINYSVFGSNQRYSAVAKIILSPSKNEVMKMIALNKNCLTELKAEERIIKKSVEILKVFYEKNY